MIIRSAEFVKSAVTPEGRPPEGLPEIAFAGRSNAGKSSLINSLVSRKSLAKSSSEPGKTRLINFFMVNYGFYFVDLPGYGYAKVSQSEREKWKPMIENYITALATLKGMVVVADIRREAAEEETALSNWLASLPLPTLWVLSKADKISKSEQCRQQAAFSDALSVDRANVIVFSAKSGQGRDEIWERMPIAFSMRLADGIPPGREEKKNHAHGKRAQ